MEGRSFLIDTNVVIQLEDQKPVKADFADLVQLCGRYNVTLVVHEASRVDICEDSNLARRAITLSKIAKFGRIENVATPPESVLAARFGEIKKGNDRVDVALLNALDRNAADFLITEDLGIHKRARIAHLQDRVFRVREAIDWLITEYEPTEVRLPFVVERYCYELDTNDSIFDTLREGYDDFDSWFVRNARRRCWSLEIGGELAGLVIRKENEPVAETDATLNGSKILKLCTFKVKESFQGEKFGEHLLKQCLWYAQQNNYDLVYLTAFADDQKVLVDLIEQYGFQQTGIKGRTGEAIFEKEVGRGPVESRGLPLDDDLRNYPRFREDDAVNVYCIPIQPRWYRVLFPENDPEPTLLFGSAVQHSEARTAGNTIRKVYLCRTPTRELNGGDILLFYVSGNEIGSRAVRTVGIVERMNGVTDPETLLRITGRRSVYTWAQQLQMLAERDSPLKVIDFLVVGHLKEALELELLQDLRLVRAAPQSLVRIDNAKVRVLELHRLLGYV